LSQRVLHLVVIVWFGCLLFCMLITWFNISTLAYPFCLIYVSLFGFSFLQWSTIYWCEHRREPLMVLRMVKMVLHSVVPMVWVVAHCWAPSKELLVYFKFLALWAVHCKMIVLLCSVYGIVVCLNFLPSILMDECISVSFILYLCDVLF